MINVDEVTASRLIFAPMGVFFGKCCGNATSTIACGRSPNRGELTPLRESRRSRGNIKLAPLKKDTTNK